MARTAVITGGTGGMGLATAKVLGLDHRIVLADLDQARIDAAVAELAELGIDATGGVCDITQPESIEALLALAESGGHHVRAVVHTAAISPSMGSAQLVARINVGGTVNVARAFLPRAAEGDALVMVASTGAYSVPAALIPFRSFRLAEHRLDDLERAVVARSRIVGRKLHSGLAYAISKAFVVWYARRLASAFGQRGARVVSVSPGSFDTAMGRLEESRGSGKLAQSAAIKRFGKPEEIAAVLAFCAAEAPGYLTGTDILVDGGARAAAEFRGRS
jgi:NAD(P)-dependent dehydrogenase (short-subunit alcohol dehydrogenase family)